MKKSLLINMIILFLVIGSITGCGNIAAQGKHNGEAPAVISVWYSLGGKAEQELVKQFDRINKEHPEVVVKGEKISEAKFVDQVWNFQAGGEGPEIFITSRPVIFALYEKGAISPVLADKYTAFPAAKAVFTFNQQPFAAPWLTDVPLLYYRKDKIQEVPVSLAAIMEKKVPIGVKSFNAGLLSPWWKAEGGSFILSGKPALDSQTNLAFLNKLLSLRSEGLLIVDQASERFRQGEINYLLSWASESTALTQAGVDWGSISLNSLLGSNGKVLLDQTIGIANSSIKTFPAMEDAIRIVQEELLKAETEASMQKAGGKLPVEETFYDGAKIDTLNAQVALTLKEAWHLEGYLSDWKLLPLQDKAWQNITQGANIEGELTIIQQTALKVEKS